MMLHCQNGIFHVCCSNLPFDLVLKLEDLRYMRLASVWGWGGVGSGLPHVDIKIHRCFLVPCI